MSSLVTPPSGLPLTDLMRGLRRGTVSSRQLTEDAIAAHERHGNALNAYRTFSPDRARARADTADRAFAEGRDLGPLQGLPVSVKDLFGVAGLPTYAGTPRRLPHEWEREGPLVSRIQEQLGVIVGKTHTVEFALGGLGTNRHYGSPYNPWGGGEQRISGGSSSGAGVSLLEGSALIAIGSDTTGSVRMPASMTGTVGLMVSHGRWSTDGIVPVAPILDAPGLLTLTVADLVVAFEALDTELHRGHESPSNRACKPLDRVRIGVLHGLFWDNCSPGVVEGVEAALNEIGQAGARLVPIELAHVNAIHDMFQEGHLSTAAVYGLIRSEFPDWWETLDLNVRARLESHGANLPAHEYVRRMRTIDGWMRAADSVLADVDAIACPTVSVTPARIADLATPDAYRRHNLEASRNSAIIALLGLTAITIPVALDAVGMPVGLQLAARHGLDRELLALALACEQVIGTRALRVGEPAFLKV